MRCLNTYSFFIPEYYSIHLNNSHFDFHLCVDGYLTWLHFVTLRSEATLNSHLLVFMSTCVLKSPWDHIVLLYVCTYAYLLGQPLIVFRVTMPFSAFYIPFSSIKKSLNFSNGFYVHCFLFNYDYPGSWETTLHCGFDLHFFEDLWCWTSLHMLIVHLFIFFGEMPFLILQCVWKWLCLWEGIWSLSSFHNHCLLLLWIFN